MVHTIQQVANNSAINSQHIVALENMSTLVANAVSQNRQGLDIAYILLNIGRMVCIIQHFPFSLTFLLHTTVIKMCFS